MPGSTLTLHYTKRMQNDIYISSTKVCSFANTQTHGYREGPRVRVTRTLTDTILPLLPSAYSFERRLCVIARGRDGVGRAEPNAVVQGRPTDRASEAGWADVVVVLVVVVLVAACSLAPLADSLREGRKIECLTKRRSIAAAYDASQPQCLWPSSRET